MSRTVIEVAGVGKQYRLGQVGTGTISHDLNRFWARMRGKEDPYMKITEVNNHRQKSNSGWVWALKDINFEVKQGEVLGIIGKNGAGKSTLFKLISRVTSPTVGTIKAKGRIASLLEVGTGFHPELSGRENIFLNGAILGMTKSEIRAKFDEIVEFSGVERYIDTPVKRYSSGMYVRLAFAVAAHLESEILIIDEVLAVGDAEFQKKCLGKMKDVSEEGRTVLYVSHNMPSIRELCNSAIILKAGTIYDKGKTTEMIPKYLSENIQTVDNTSGIILGSVARHNTGEARFTEMHVLSENEIPSRIFHFKEKVVIKLRLDVLKKLEKGLISVHICNAQGETVIMGTENENYTCSFFESGNYEVIVKFEDELMPGTYNIGISICDHKGSSIDHIENLEGFKVLRETLLKDMEYPFGPIHGYIKPKTNWKIKKN